MLSHYAIEAALIAVIWGVCSSAQGAVAYDESVSGDLSNSGSAPTVVDVHLGSNSIFGTTGFGATAIDLDYFSITVPAGQVLSALTVLPGTSVGGDVSFIAVQTGSQFTVPPTTPNAAGLFGWWHYSDADINSDILPKMGVPNDGSTGFTAPLGPGKYSFWVQDFDGGPVTYGFGLTLSAAVPEPGTYAMLATGLVCLIGVRGRARFEALSRNLSRG